MFLSTLFFVYGYSHKNKKSIIEIEFICRICIYDFKFLMCDIFKLQGI